MLECSRVLVLQGTVKEGNIGIEVSVRRKPLAVYDYAMDVRKT